MILMSFVQIFTWSKSPQHSALVFASLILLFSLPIKTLEKSFWVKMMLLSLVFQSSNFKYHSNSLPFELHTHYIVSVSPSKFFMGFFNLFICHYIHNSACQKYT